MHYLFHYEVNESGFLGHFLPFFVAQHTLEVVQRPNIFLHEMSAVVKNETSQCKTFQLRLKSL